MYGNNVEKLRKRWGNRQVCGKFFYDLKYGDITDLPEKK